MDELTTLPAFQAINEALQSTGAPLKVVSGYIGRVTVSVPWSALLKENCKVEISGLAVSIAPYSVPYQNDDEQGMYVLYTYCACTCAHYTVSCIYMYLYTHVNKCI